MMQKKVSIGKTMVGDGEPCLVSLEPAAAYTSVEEAKSLLAAVAESGADAVKFQTLLPGYAERTIGGRKDITVGFGTKAGQRQESVFEALVRRELPISAWKELAEITHKQHLLFITTVEFLDTVDFLLEIGADAIKISKGDMDNVLLIEASAKTKLPIILDGREKFEDVAKAIELCERTGNTNIVIMHCPSGYPSPDEAVHLNALKLIKEIYGYPVGFADHSVGDTMNYAAVAMGANMLEKTVSLDRATEGVEHFMSLEPKELPEFVSRVRSVEKAMGSPSILFTSRVAKEGKRCFVAKRDIQAGEEITLEILDFQRPGDAGISVASAHELLGRKTKEAIQAGSFLQWDQVV